MSRVIKTENAGRERKRLTSLIVQAIRQLSQQTTIDDTTMDLFAFIILSLEAISNSVDNSVLAWEKRGYWVKADRYRMEWSWSSRFAGELREGLRKEDWVSVAQVNGKILEKLQLMKVPKNNRNPVPWSGAWEQLQKSSGNRNER